MQTGEIFFRGASMPPKRKRHPLPWWLVTDAPALAIATGGVYRATWQLAVAYWASGCQPLPTDDTTLAALVRIPTGHWKAVAAQVNQALDEITPHLDTEWHRLVARWKAQAAGAEYATQRSIMKLAEKRLAQAAQITEYLPARQDIAPVEVVIAANAVTHIHERQGLSDTPRQRSKPASKPTKPADSGFTD